jgi:glycosyltransferase involved in cell wall biosynthesis
MSTVRTIAMCASQVPLRSGGAEILVMSLHREFVRRGYRAEIIQVPFKWYPRAQILKCCLAWRLLDLSESDSERIDLVIATKFPSYVVKHPNKVVWLIHQFRQVYDQFGTPLSDFGKSPEDLAYRDAIIALDNRVLRESRRILTNSRNTARRLARFNGIVAEPLYHPPKLHGRYRNEEYGDYLFTASRLDRAKRLDLLIRAMALTRPEARLLIAGSGPEHDALSRLIEQLGLGDRVKLLGYVPDEDLISLYARCCAVAYVPFDEDYGYVTLEAFASGKPVITVKDSGGALEFVEDGVTGCIADSSPESIAACIGELWSNRSLAARLGSAGQERIKDISWDNVIDQLLQA